MLNYDHDDIHEHPVTKTPFVSVDTFAEITDESNDKDVNDDLKKAVADLCTLDDDDASAFPFLKGMKWQASAIDALEKAAEEALEEFFND